MLKFRQYKIHVAEAFAEVVVGGAEAEAREIVGAKVRNSRFEAIIAARTAPLAVADFAKFEVKIVANDEKILGLEFVIMSKRFETLTDFVIKRLRLNEEFVTVFEILNIKFVIEFPVKAVNFGIKISRQKAEVVAGKIVL